MELARLGMRAPNLAQIFPEWSTTQTKKIFKRATGLRSASGMLPFQPFSHLHRTGWGAIDKVHASIFWRFWVKSSSEAEFCAAMVAAYSEYLGKVMMPELNINRCYFLTCQNLELCRCRHCDNEFLRGSWEAGRECLQCNGELSRALGMDKRYKFEGDRNQRLEYFLSTVDY